MVLYLYSPQTKVRLAGGRLRVERDGEAIDSVRIAELECVVATRVAELTTPVIYALMEAGVSVFYIDGRARIVAELVAGSLSWERTRRQYEYLLAAGHAEALARLVVREKLSAQIKLLRSYAHTRKNQELYDIADELGDYRQELEHTESLSIEEIRGIEGMAAKRYFSAYPHIIDAAKWQWEGRNRRPPEDPINALLSYGYAFLERDVRLAILYAGLDARIGFLHSNNGRKDSLVYDLMDIVRPSIIDRLVLKLVNRNQFSPADFGYDSDLGCRLSEAARVTWATAYEEYMVASVQEYDGRTPREEVERRVREIADIIYGRRELA